MTARPDPARGVFETLLVDGGRIQALEPHLHRLAASTATLYGIEPPPGLAASLRRHVAALAGPHRVRVDAVPTGGGLDVTFTASPLDPARPRAYRCAPVTIPGGHGPHKWVDRDQLAAPDGSGAVVALIVDEAGDVLEAAWANVFVLAGDELATPPTDGRLLPGVTRARLLALAPALGLTPRERPISIAEARAARSVILTSSLALAATAAVDHQPADDEGTADRLRAALAADDWE